MKLPPTLDPLFNQAWSLVRRFIQDQGTFIPFALMLGTTGQTTPIQVAEEAKDLNTAIAELIKHLLPNARSGQVTATVICMPMPKSATPYKADAVVFDLESMQKERILAIMQYHKSERYGWNFGPIEYKRDQPKLFASPSTAPQAGRAPTN